MAVTFTLMQRHDAGRLDVTQAALHFDCVQAHSGQLLMPASLFSLGAATAGLMPSAGTLTYPKDSGYTRIVLQQLRPAGYKVRRCGAVDAARCGAFDAVPCGAAGVGRCGAVGGRGHAERRYTGRSRSATVCAVVSVPAAVPLSRSHSHSKTHSHGILHASLTQRSALMSLLPVGLAPRARLGVGRAALNGAKNGRARSYRAGHQAEAEEAEEAEAVDEGRGVLLGRHP